MLACWHPPAHLAPRSCHSRRSLWRQGRWRQLRSCAGALESITWAYRTRVPPFGPSNNTDHDLAERELRRALISWREQLAAGADLNTTTLRRNFPPRVFKHGQRRPKADSWWQHWTNNVFCFHATSFAAQKFGLDSPVNDHYSSVKAEDYIKLRLRPAVDFYQKLVPIKTHQHMTVKLVLLTAAIASCFLARYQYILLVTIVTAFASMMIAYSVFVDADRKVER